MKNSSLASFALNITLFIGISLFFVCCNTQKNQVKDATENSAIKTDKVLQDTLPPNIQIRVEEDLFSVQFPQMPVKELDSLNNDVSYTFVNQEDSSTYTLFYKDFSEKDFLKATTPEKFLEDACKSVMENFKNKEIIESNKTKRDNHLSFTIKASTPADNYYLIYELVLVDKRLYQFGVSKFSGYPHQAQVRGFMNSFKLKKKGVQTSKS